jgi:hypothetical protein
LIRYGADQRANSRAATQDAQASRPDMEDVIGEYRWQRDRATEQDREQVQQDRPQQDLGTADEAQALEHGPNARGLARRLRRGPVHDEARTDRDRRQRCKRAGPGSDQVHGRGREPVDDAAQPRPEHLRSLAGNGAQRHRARDQLTFDERRWHRPGGRLPERHRHAGTYCEGQIWEHCVDSRRSDDRKPYADRGSEQVGTGQHVRHLRQAGRGRESEALRALRLGPRAAYHPMRRASTVCSISTTSSAIA